MDVNSINEKIKMILDKSKESRQGTFKRASDDSFILSEYIDAYEELLKRKEFVREYEEFYEQNKAIIDKYNELRKHVEMPDIPGLEDLAASKEEVPAETEEQTIAESPVLEVVKEEPIITPIEVEASKNAEVIEKPVLEVVKEEPIVAPVELPKNTEIKEEVQEPVLEVVKEEPIIAPVELEPVKTDTVSPVESPVIDNEYLLSSKDNGIIQDIDLSNHEVPAMTDEQIKDSQDLINSVPTVSAPEIDPLQAEIERLKAEYDNRKVESTPAAPAEPFTYTPMTAAEINASQEKLGIEPPEPLQTVEPVKPANRRGGKRVAKREKFNWKDRVSKKVCQLKGMLYKEIMSNHTEDYMKICQMIANFRVNYKTISNDEANKGLEAIDKVISESTMLSFDEKKRLYRKLSRLALAVEMLNTMRNNPELMYDNSYVGLAV